MEITQGGVVELVKITDLAFEDLPSAVGFAVCRAIEPAEEVGRLVVEGIIDEMVYFSDVRITVLADVDRSGAIESERHEDVAVLASEIAHYRRIVPSLRLFSAFGWTIIVQNFLSQRAEKIAVRMSPEDFFVDKVRRYRTTALSEKPQTG